MNPKNCNPGQPKKIPEIIPALANNSTKKMSEVKRRGPGLQNRIKNPPPMIPAAIATILYIPVKSDEGEQY